MRNRSWLVDLRLNAAGGAKDETFFERTVPYLFLFSPWAQTPSAKLTRKPSADFRRLSRDARARHDGHALAKIMADDVDICAARQSQLRGIPQRLLERTLQGGQHHSRQLRDFSPRQGRPVHWSWRHLWCHLEPALSHRKGRSAKGLWE